MTTRILGIDLSTKRLDGCVIPLDPGVAQYVTFRTEHLTKTLDEGTRFREIHEAVSRLTQSKERPPVQTPAVIDGEARTVTYTLLGQPPDIEWDITSCWVEQPRGPHAVRQLSAVYGAVMASIPLHIARAAIDPQEWRAELSLPKSLPKPDAIKQASTWLAKNLSVNQRYVEPDEHQSEALLVALAGRELTWRHHQGTAA